jgi:hypothetical protein
VLGPEHPQHATLVLRIGVRVQEHDPEGIHAPLAEPAGHPRRLLHVERAQHLAPEAQPLVDLHHPLEGDDPIGLHPGVRVAVAGRYALARDLQDVAEPAGDDQSEARELLLEQSVRRDRGPVRHADDRPIGRPQAGPGEHLSDPLRESERGVVGRARGLDAPDVTGRLVDRDDVGERPAGIDADP